jgi:hypothetical protein
MTTDTIKKEYPASLKSAALMHNRRYGKGQRNDSPNMATNAELYHNRRCNCSADAAKALDELLRYLQLPFN